MTISLLPKGDWSLPGTWVPHLRDDGSDGAIVICPKCKQGAQTVAKIEAEGHYHGLLMDKFTCPQKECGWSDNVKLMWWHRKHNER